MRAKLALSRTGRFEGIGYQWRTVALSGMTGTNPNVLNAGWINGRYAAFVNAFSTQGFWYTTDLQTWQFGSATTLRGGNAQDFTTDGTALIFGGSTSTNQNYLAVSNDGINWGTYVDPILPGQSAAGATIDLAFGNGILICSTGYRTIDFVNFTETSPVTFGSKAFGNNIFCALQAVGSPGLPPDNGQLYASSDGITWDAISGLSGTRLSYAGGLFWLAKASSNSPPSTLFKSANGVDWEQVYMPSSFDLVTSVSKVLKGGNVWMFGGEQNTIGLPQKSFISHDALNFLDVSTITTRRPQITNGSQFISTASLQATSAIISP